MLITIGKVILSRWNKRDKPNMKGGCGMRIKELREARGLNQTRVAEAMGVSQVAVAKWEAGRAFPAGERLPALADLLGCTIDALYGRKPPQEPPSAAAS